MIQLFALLGMREVSRQNWRRFRNCRRDGQRGEEIFRKMFRVQKWPTLILPCWGKLPYEHSRVAKFPSLECSFLWKFMNNFLPNFPELWVKLRIFLSRQHGTHLFFGAPSASRPNRFVLRQMNIWILMNEINQSFNINVWFWLWWT